jgi:glutaredoxin
MAIKLHRCSLTWLKIPPHSCHRVEKALQRAGVDYETVKEPAARSKREWVKQATGQEKLPVIEFEDGSVYRAESKEMAARIEQGRLFQDASPGAATGA